MKLCKTLFQSSRFDYVGILIKWLFFYCFVFSAFAQEKKIIQAAGNPEIVNKGGQEVLIEGLMVVEGGVNPDKVEQKKGVHILVGNNNYQPLIDQLKKFLNQPLSEKALKEIRKIIVDYFRDDLDIHAAAVVPVQKVSDGVIGIQLLQGRIGKIEFKGQKWFPERVLKNAIGIKVGDPLDENEFLNDVTWSNKNPFRSTQMVLVPGKAKGRTDLVFVTKDRFPVRFYVGADNTGFVSNDVYRVFGGFNWGNAFAIGDLLSYQYTASPNFHQFQSHTANYTSFLPWKHILTVFGTYGLVYPLIPNFTVEGVNVQGSARYQIPIRPFYGLFRSYAELGFDYKFLRSNTAFIGDLEQALITNQMITITQFLVSYQFQKNTPRNLLTFKLNMFLSPWKSWFPHQTTEEYGNLRPSSHVRYAYWRGAITDVYTTLRKIGISWKLRGQLATGTLPVAEQFGLGGANSVRGYNEQQFVADDAILTNLEIFTPPRSLFKGVKNELSFLAFCDYGYGYNYSAIAPEFIDQSLLGIGLGVRYDIVPYFKGKLDYGFQILEVENGYRFGRFHFSVIASY